MNDVSVWLAYFNIPIAIWWLFLCIRWHVIQNNTTKIMLTRPEKIRQDVVDAAVRWDSTIARGEHGEAMINLIKAVEKYKTWKTKNDEEERGYL